MIELQFTAEECEEIIPAAVQALSSAWDLLAKALSCAFLGKYWVVDGTWKGYCERTMGLEREFPKTLRDLLIIAMTEAGVTLRPTADALGVGRDTVSRVAAGEGTATSFGLGADGKRYERKPFEAPVISPEKAARIAATDVIRDLYRVTDKLARFTPASKEAATMLRVDIRSMIQSLEARLSWVDKNWDELPDLGNEDDPDYS